MDRLTTLIVITSTLVGIAGLGVLLWSVGDMLSLHIGLQIAFVAGAIVGGMLAVSWLRTRYSW